MPPDPPSGAAICSFYKFGPQNEIASYAYAASLIMQAGDSHTHIYADVSGYYQVVI